MKKILILLGGLSSEKEVSIKTGEAVFEVLQDSDYEVEKFYLTQENIKELIDTLYQNKNNIIIFNALHGTFGEDGRIQSLLDILQVPYTHSGQLCSAIAMHKVLTKNIASTCGIKVASDQVINVKNFNINDLKVKYPFIIKPINEGSSMGLYLVNNEKQLKDTLSKAINLKQVMLEQYLKGTECTVAVMNGRALEVTEISYESELFDYDSKYVTKVDHFLPARLNQNLIEVMKEQAQQLFYKLEANGLIRVDFIVVGEEIYLLEVNTQPGMTETSLAPEQALKLGISFKELCLQLLSSAKHD